MPGMGASLVCMHTRGLSLGARPARSPGRGDLPSPSSVLPSRSPCQQQKLISTKSNKQGPAQGPGPYLASRRHTGNLTNATSTGVASSSDALAAGLCMPRAGDGSFALPGSALPSLRSVAGRTRQAQPCQERRGNKGSHAAVTHVCHCCGEKAPEKKVCGNKSQEHHPLPLPLQWKSFKGGGKN